MPHRTVTGRGDWVDDETRCDLVHATLLKDAGCSSNALRVYELFGALSMA